MSLLPLAFLHVRSAWLVGYPPFAGTSVPLSGYPQYLHTHRLSLWRRWADKDKERQLGIRCPHSTSLVHDVLKRAYNIGLDWPGSTG